MESGTVDLGLERKGLPDGSPSRWHEKHYDMLEFRFSFVHVFDLSIIGTPPAPEFNVALQLEKRAAKLLSPDPRFTFALKFHLVELDLHPFNARVALDLQARWFRQA